MVTALGEHSKCTHSAGVPVLCTSMGRGLLPDNHPLCVNAARGAALRGADVALVVGARLNW
jgi:2-hydroxyacyl-CoA lyase 1